MVDRYIEDARRRFLMPPQSEDLSDRVNQIDVSLSDRHGSIADTFRANLHSVLSSVGIPFSLAFASAQSTYFERFHIPEQILARDLHLVPFAYDDTLEHVRENIAVRAAQSRMDEFAESTEGREELMKDACEVLLSATSDYGFASGALNLLQQGTVLVWSAFEVLFRDAFELELNLRPSKILLLAQNLSTKKRFDVDRISLVSVREDLELDESFVIQERRPDSVGAAADVDDRKPRTL